MTDSVDKLGGYGHRLLISKTKLQVKVHDILIWLHNPHLNCEIIVDSLPSDDSPFPNDDKLLNRDDDSLIPFVPLFALTNSKSWVCNDIFPDN